VGSLFRYPLRVGCVPGMEDLLNSSLTVQGLMRAILATCSSYIRRLLLVLILPVFG
jgi:hypothetical protein